MIGDVIGGKDGDLHREIARLQSALRQSQDKALEAERRMFEMSKEMTRLYEELAKANGACHDMASELHGLLNQIDNMAYQETVMQNKLERAEFRADQYMLKLAKATALQPAQPFYVCRKCGDSLFTGTAVKGE